jgi:hypothetical protein
MMDLTLVFRFPSFDFGIPLSIIWLWYSAFHYLTLVFRYPSFDFGILLSIMESGIPKSNNGKRNTKVKWWIAEYQSQMMDSGIPKSNDGKQNTKVK